MCPDAPLPIDDPIAETTAIEALDRALDTLSDDPRGEHSGRVNAPPDRSSPLGGIAVALRALDDARPPDPAFVARLEGQLMSEFAIASDPTCPPAAPPRVRSWRPTAPHVTPRPSFPAVSRRRGLIEFATLAALIAIIFGQTLGLGAGLAFWQDATPSATTDSPLAMERVDAGRTGTYPGPGPEGEIGLITRLAPTLAADANGGMPFFLNPMLAGDTVYQPEVAGSSVSAYGLSSGSYWPGVRTPDMRSNIAVGHGHVYVNEQPRMVAPGTAGSLVALDQQTWSEVWRYPLAGAVYAAVLVSGDLVYALDAAGTIHAVKGETGEAAWTAAITVGKIDVGDGRLEPFSVAGNAWLSAGHGIVAVSVLDHRLHAFDTATGEPRWTFDAPDGTSVGAPVVTDDSVVVVARAYHACEGAGDGALYRLDAATGAVRWSTAIGPWAPELADPETSPCRMDDGLMPTVDDRHAYVPDLGPQANELAAISLDDGDEVWRVASDRSGLNPPVVAGETLYLVRGDGRIAALSTADGSERWSLATGKVGLTTPVVAPNRIATIAGDGTLFVLGPAGESTMTPVDGAPADDISGLEMCVPPRLQPDPLPVGTPAEALPVAPGGQLRLADVPTGPVADGETFAGIFQTLDAMPACRRADTQRELGGFYSDDYYRRIPADVPEASRRQVYLGFREDGNDISLAELNAPYRLPDGRVGLLLYDETFESGSLIVFVEQDGAWLIDEQQPVALEPCTTCG